MFQNKKTPIITLNESNNELVHNNPDSINQMWAHGHKVKSIEKCIIQKLEIGRSAIQWEKASYSQLEVYAREELILSKYDIKVYR